MAHRLTCPQCGEPRLTRSKRSGVFEKWFLGSLGWFPWRCKSCKGRVLLRNRGSRQQEDPDSTIRNSRATL